MSTNRTSFAAPTRGRAAFAMVGLLLVTGACGSASKDAPSPVAAVATTPPPTAAPVTQPPPTVARTPPPTTAPVTQVPTTVSVAPAASARITATMPEVRRENLSVAFEELVALGFKVITHDSTGAGRGVLLRTNWSVTTQNLAPGTKIILPFTVDLGVKKLDE